MSKNWTPPKVMTCHQCKLEKSMMFFNHLPNDTRCDECVPTRLHQQIREKQLMQVRKDSHDLVNALTNSESLPRIDQFLTDFMRRYGGMGKFVELMVQDLKELEKEKHGTLALFDRKMGILKLVKESTKMLDDREIDEMTDEEIREAKAVAMAKTLVLMAENPAMLEIVRRAMNANNIPVDEQMVREVLSG